MALIEDAMLPFVDCVLAVEHNQSFARRTVRQQAIESAGYLQLAKVAGKSDEHSRSAKPAGLKPLLALEDSPESSKCHQGGAALISRAKEDKDVSRKQPPRSNSSSERQQRNSQPARALAPKPKAHAARRLPTKGPAKARAAGKRAVAKAGAKPSAKAACKAARRATIKAGAKAGAPKALGKAFAKAPDKSAKSGGKAAESRSRSCGACEKRKGVHLTSCPRSKRYRPASASVALDVSPTCAPLSSAPPQRAAKEVETKHQAQVYAGVSTRSGRSTAPRGRPMLTQREDARADPASPKADAAAAVARLVAGVLGRTSAAESPGTPGHLVSVSKFEPRSKRTYAGPRMKVVLRTPPTRKQQALVSGPKVSRHVGTRSPAVKKVLRSPAPARRR
mmetsp:Transcript_38029/g.83122  ORF Transcript_38029/g.83122 Transcript_38029/m.83122 type:complete len:392 (+) Transcript_38029:1-1176(+)